MEGAAGPLREESYDHQFKLLESELMGVTERAAIAAARLMGYGDRNQCDRVAVEAMRRELEKLELRGTVVIGEGERDEAPMLYIGERVGRPDADLEVAIAVDPLEGTNLCAHGRPGAISVLAVSVPGGLISAPDIYMEKIMVGSRAADAIDMNLSVSENLHRVAEAMDRELSEIVLVCLDRPRHQELVEEARKTGVRIKLIPDGDLSAAVSVAFAGTGDHIVMGIGGAPEGVLSAAALKCMGGRILARFRPRNETERERLVQMGADPDRIYDTEDLAPGDRLLFVASGVTDGDLLPGVKFFEHGSRVSSLVMNYGARTIRLVSSILLKQRKDIHIWR